ncbi:Glycosyltransferase involved in cell wall bisynthesis [Bosea sp. CRIB-10]|nr:Glycosyltransferase involved in cell wall bisynthesis [Bosea sp. CRIB-10]
MTQKRTYLFIHQNMPAQFLHLCRYLRDHGHRVVFITRNKTNHLQGVTKVSYETTRGPHKDSHVYLRAAEDGVLHGQAVFRAIKQQLGPNFKPDIVIGHAGWGEMLLVKEAFPDVPVLSYFEFFYRSRGQDLGFDSEYMPDLDTMLATPIKNTINLLSGEACDWGLTPTRWQFSTYPTGIQSKMSVIHEGVDTQAIRPKDDASFTTPSGKVLKAGQKIVTFVARNLEPYRGFHIFMRALPEIQRRHPDAEILIVGSEGTSYGRKLPEGDSYKKRMLAEVSFDPETVHFTGHLDTPRFREVMQVSSAHIYLTYPFVLSWSMLEAMASGCLLIGSRTAPVEEVLIDGRNGLLVDFFDRQGLVDRICEALAKPERFIEMRRAARETVVAHYDLRSHCLPRQLGLIAHLIGSR